MQAKMSSRDQVMQIIDRMPEYQIDGLLGLLRVFVDHAPGEEADDEAFCLHMLEDYQNDPDPEKEKGYTLEACKREWGLA